MVSKILWKPNPESLNRIAKSRCDRFHKIHDKNTKFTAQPSPNQTLHHPLRLPAGAPSTTPASPRPNTAITPATGTASSGPSAPTATAATATTRAGAPSPSTTLVKTRIRLGPGGEVLDDSACQFVRHMD
jgi:hypothetical protein